MRLLTTDTLTATLTELHKEDKTMTKADLTARRGRTKIITGYWLNGNITSNSQSRLVVATQNKTTATMLNKVGETVMLCGLRGLCHGA